jgi:adenylylsulfate kinase-like enzyme
LIQTLRRQKIPVLTLDGDVLRSGLCRGLGLSEPDRMENLRRAAVVARLGTDFGICVIAPFNTPLESHRQLIKEIIGGDQASMIFADAPPEVCRQRDVKGPYARAEAGQIPQMAGVSSAFGIPAKIDLRLLTLR